MSAESTPAGRDARRPAEISVRGWRQVLWRIWLRIGLDNLWIVAAGCAFWALLAMIPAVTMLILVYGFLSDPTEVEAQLATIAGLVPREVYQLIQEEMKAVASQPEAGIGWGLVLTLAFALWTASSGIKALFSALNIAYREEEKRGIIHFNLLGLAFTLAGMLAIVVALAVIVGIPAAMAYVGLEEQTRILIRIVRWPLIAVLVVLGLAILYRYGPSRRAARTQWISWGSITATVIWLLASIAFSFYAANFASYNATYGSLGAVVVVLMWLYVTAFAILLGGELNAELELQTEADTTVGSDKPMGKRGAFVADHVAAEPPQ